MVRLNEAEYDGAEFESSGVRFHDLPFDDCTAPPDAVARRFLDIVDAAPGAVAVHCSAGLGRTGTLIGLYLMRREGFTAREAMGWLRIMRPGSVIGEQQHYLCAVEAALQARRGRASGAGAGAGFRDTAAAASAVGLGPGMRPRSAPDAVAAGALAEQVSAGMIRRAASRH